MMDSIYIKLAKIQAEMSPDKETQVACLLLDRAQKSAVMGSWNDFISTRFRYILPNTRPNKYFYIQHAEQRLLYKCAQDGIKTNYGILVSTHSPCVSCALALFQAGIDTIYCDVMRPETEMINDRLDLKATLKKLKTGVYKLKLSLRS